MNPRGEDIARVVREWAESDIKSGPACRSDLGKFFFSVSSATIGLLVGAGRLKPSEVAGLPTAVGLGLIGFSLVVAVKMAVPRIWELRGDTELFHEYKRHMQLIMWLSATWFTSWVIGSGIVIYATLSRGAL